MTEGQQESYDRMNAAFGQNTVHSASPETLSKYLVSLSNQPIQNSAVQHRDIIRGITINHILLQRHIDSLNKQNSTIQKWVIALAVAALISSVAQIFSPLLFPLQPTASTQQEPAAQSATPTQAQPQGPGQATVKKH
jgi:hypothetical protein